MQATTAEEDQMPVEEGCEAAADPTLSFVHLSSLSSLASLSSSSSPESSAPSPSLSRSPSAADLTTTLRVLSFLCDHPDYLHHQHNEQTESGDTPTAAQHRSLRRCLLSLSGILNVSILSKKGETDVVGLKRSQLVKQQKKHLAATQQRLKEADHKHINSVLIRQQRIAALQGLVEQQGQGTINNGLLAAAAVSASSDASAASPTIVNHSTTVLVSQQGTRQRNKQQLHLHQQGIIIEQTKQTSDKQHNMMNGHSLTETDRPFSNGVSSPPAACLTFPRSCYQCKSRFVLLHPFYDQLCPSCATENWTKRQASSTANMTGMICLLTGCRVKIGFCVGLRLLRAGATLIGTSRFPYDTAQRYTRQADSNRWKHRLHLYGLDLRDLAAVQRFINLIDRRFPAIHCLINNAAQTVRRPTAYYSHLMAIETQTRTERPKEWTDIVQPDEAHQQRMQTYQQLETHNAVTHTPPEQQQQQVGSSVVSPNVNLSLAPLSAVLSQCPVTLDDVSIDHGLFPVGMFDVTGQQLDLRTINSWLLRLEQVSIPELVEVFAINALAPYILTGGIRHTMRRGQLMSSSPHRYIIQVSAMEGKFYRHKSPAHPHTNMAKAALNMMVRTSAQDYATDHIYMNAVDTGWINDENPYDRAATIAGTGFQTPIDEEDAAARILDPIITGVTERVYHYGKFFKDYHETEW